MGKTYKKNSRHNLYNPSWANHNTRIPVELCVKFKKKAKELGISEADFERQVISEAVKDVKLTSADVMNIAERIRKNEEANQRRLEKAGE